MKKQIYTKKAPQPVGNYSQALLIDPFLFISGQIAVDPETGKLAGPGINEQVIRVMANVQAILNEAGMSMKDVIKTTLYLTDLGHFEIVNEIYGSYFAEPMPVRDTIETSRLPKNSQLELSVIAYRGMETNKSWNKFISLVPGLSERYWRSALS